MTMGWEQGFGLVDLVVAVAIIVGSALATLRATRHTAMLETLVAVSFLPEKRQRYMTILSFEGCFILLAGILWGLGQAGVLAGPLWVALVDGLVLAASLSVGGLTWVGLSRSRLTDGDRAALRRMAPQILQSMVFAPVVALAPEDAAGQ
jgi:hypothetical protein